MALTPTSVGVLSNPVLSLTRTVTLPTAWPSETLNPGIARVPLAVMFCPAGVVTTGPATVAAVALVPTSATTEAVLCWPCGLVTPTQSQSLPAAVPW